MKPRARPLLLLLIPAMAVGCSDEGQNHEPVVFAAASLTDAFEEMLTATERDPRTSVTFNFGSSSDLARSIEDGSPAEVFASADELTMDGLVEQGLVEDVQIFATNRLAIAVELDNPQDIDDLEDLDGDVALALCAPEVPCGRYARDVLDRAGIDVEPRSLEPDVRAVLTRVALGEVDAGIVYESDVLTSDEVSSVSIPDDVNVVASYPIALVGSGSGDAARAFYELVLSKRGSDILERHGFDAP
jgi:molybdate transport system substrate-binding protein